MDWLKQAVDFAFRFAISNLTGRHGFMVAPPPCGDVVLVDVRTHDIQ